MQASTRSPCFSGRPSGKQNGSAVQEREVNLGHIKATMRCETGWVRSSVFRFEEREPAFSHSTIGGLDV